MVAETGDRSRGLFQGAVLGLCLSALLNLVLILGHPLVPCAIDWAAAAAAARGRLDGARDGAPTGDEAAAAAAAESEAHAQPVAINEAAAPGPARCQ